MILYKTKKVTTKQREFTGFICDKCKAKFESGNHVETQEFYAIRVSGGYGSVFENCSMLIRTRNDPASGPCSRKLNAKGGLNR
jgi:regulation of enolase protein 1 (concanavalin A-like superfamily)